MGWQFFQSPRDCNMAIPPKFSNYQEMVEWVVEAEMHALPNSEQIPVENIDKNSEKSEIEIIGEIERELEKKKKLNSLVK